MRAGAKRFMPLIWQAVFILLPVTLLSVVSLISLRGDAQRTEKDAQNRGAQDVQTLAGAIRATVDAELQRFLLLENAWTTGLRLPERQAATVDSARKLQSDIEKWETDYPRLMITDLATPQAEVLTDGRQIQPPELATSPIPPEWFRALSPRQHKIWTRLKYAINTSGNDQIEMPDTLRYPSYQVWLRDLKNANTTNLFGTFLDTDPPFDAVYAATLMQTSPKDPAIDSGERTDTGLTFGELACYQVLSAKDAKLTEPLLESVWWQVIEHPSFISGRLLQLAEALTNQADYAVSQNVFWMRLCWNKESQVRDWLLPVRELSALTNWNTGTCWAAWVNGPDSGALALFDPAIYHDAPVTGPAAASDSGPSMCLIRPTQANVWNQVSPESVSIAPGYAVSFVPRQVIEAIFMRALRNNDFIPDYEAAEVTVEGESIQAQFPIADPPGRVGAAKEAPNQASVPSGWQLLGSASQRAGTLAMPDAVAFSVNLYLTDRAKMLSTEHRRFRLFAMLILGAVFSAFVGLLATWRAFYRQQELSEMKTNFVSSVSHELRAPIASVRLMAENLERGKIADAPRQNEYFRFIVQECRRLSSLIENVLDFSRIEQGRKQYEFEPANLVTIVQTTVKLLEPYAAEKGVRLEIADAGTSNIESDVDGQAIQQALVNLIDNAIKHSPKGETVTVGIERLLTRPALFLVVTDRGPGIPSEEHKKIFERFYRRGSELRRETQGIGIGLSVVQHIAEAHGGHVEVQSEPGKGSRFIIELRVKKTNE